MTLTNDGTLTIEKGYTEQFIKLLIDQNIIETPKDVEITEENETVDVELSEIYGDLTDSLENLCESCKKEGINVDGLIEYYGDYDGKYEIIGTVFHEYSSDEYALKEALETAFVQHTTSVAAYESCGIVNSEIDATGSTVR